MDTDGIQHVTGAASEEDGLVAIPCLRHASQALRGISRFLLRGEHAEIVMLSVRMRSLALPANSIAMESQPVAS